MNNYEERKDAKIKRFTELADKADKRAEQFDSARKEISSLIPMGQPILVGHHSEGRHRRDLKRIDRYFERSMEQSEKAKYYRGRIASMESNKSISSDDPEAVKKLKERVEKLEKTQATKKACNIALKKGDDKKLKELGLGEDQIKNLKTPDFCGRVGFPAYTLRNSNAKIIRLKQRIEHLKKQETKETTEKEENGIRIVNNVDENRCQLFFPGIPSIEIRTFLKSRGFRWSRFNGCWQRHLSTQATWIAEEVLKMIPSTSKETQEVAA